MSETPKTTPPGSSPSPKRYIFMTALVLTLLIVAAALYLITRHQNNAGDTASENLAAGLTEYKTANYGFKLDYPSSWGQPSVTAQTAQTKPPAGVTSEISSQTGTLYRIVFAGNSNVSVTMQSTDYKVKTCDQGQCAESTAFTGNTLSQILNHSKNGFTRKDSSSYTVLNLNKALESLTLSQEVSLPSIKVTAAVLTLNLYNPQYCSNTLASSGNGCITTSNYDDLNRVAKSIKSI